MPIENRSNRKHREVVCLCDCGKTLNVQVSNLQSGNTLSCGCLAIELQHQKAINEMIGRVFGRLTVIGESSKSWPEHICYKCQCSCGNVVDVFSTDLRGGYTRSCGCLRRELSSERNAEDITGQTFYELTAICRVDDHIGVNGLHRTRWLFRCSCGRDVVRMPMNVKRGLSKSCGHAGNRLMERKIQDRLEERGVVFEHEGNPFDDLVNPETGCKLKLDFVITNKDGELIVVEHQGAQHFRDGSWFGQQQREITDNVKREYFKKHNIRYFETRFDEDYIAHIDRIIDENNCA